MIDIYCVLLTGQILSKNLQSTFSGGLKQTNVQLLVMGMLISVSFNQQAAMLQFLPIKPAGQEQKSAYQLQVALFSQIREAWMNGRRKIKRQTCDNMIYYKLLSLTCEQYHAFYQFPSFFSICSFHSLKRKRHILLSFTFSSSLESTSFLDIHSSSLGIYRHFNIFVYSFISLSVFSNFIDSTVPVCSNLLSFLRYPRISIGLTCLGYDMDYYCFNQLQI